MYQIFAKILEIAFGKTMVCLNTVTEISTTGGVSDINDSEMGFVQAQMSLIDPVHLKVVVLSLLLFAIILVCRKIVSLDQAVMRA
jgi:hypothetical protein